MKTIIKILVGVILCGLLFSLCACTLTQPETSDSSSTVESSNPTSTVPTESKPISSTIPSDSETSIEPTVSEPEKQMYYSVTTEERLLIAQLVYREANTESLECQKAIVSVLFNRLACGKWGDTIEEVIYYKNAFTPATMGLLEGVEPTKTNYEAVDYVLENGPTLPTYVRYFRANYHHTWSGYEGYIAIDHTYFGYFTDWQNGAW